MSTFREPTRELPKWVWIERWNDNSDSLCISERRDDDDNTPTLMWITVPDAEALLEVLLDICPNAKALANNWLLERQKAEYMKGGK